MTLDELERTFRRATRIAAAEKKQRAWVFRNDEKRRTAKTGEMDELIAILVEWKDELKKHVDTGVEQPTLLDVPRRAEYK